MKLPAISSGTMFQHHIEKDIATQISGLPDLAVIPEDQLRKINKKTGETVHVEQWNCTLRQRIGRFVRKTSLSLNR